MRHLLRCELARAADMLAPPPGRSHARTGPLTDQLGLEFGERRQNVKIEPPASACRVDLFLQGTESDPGFAQAIDDLDQVGQGALSGGAAWRDAAVGRLNGV